MTRLHELELKISIFLRRGVIFSSVMLAVGWVWMLVRQGGGSLSSFANYHEQSLWESLQWAVLMNDRPVLLIYAGLFVLVTLPVFRVLLTGILFARQKEIVLSVMALGVFAALLTSFFLGVEI